MSHDPLAEEQLRHYQELCSERDAYWMTQWQMLSQYFLPEISDINTDKTPGVAGWTQRIYDTKPIKDAQILAAGQRNWLTPSNEPWAQFEPPAAQRDDDEAKSWLAKASEIVMSELARSNFYGQVNLDYKSVGVFGTGLMFLDEGKSSALNFGQFKIGTYVIQENDEGIVDDVKRGFKLTGRQALQMFGKDTIQQKCPKLYKSITEGKGMYKKYNFVHSCFPRDESDRIPGRTDGANKPFASVCIYEDEQVCVRISGYDEFPYLCSRFDKWGTGSPWGYSPAFLTLPEARQLNVVVQYTDALAELKAYPRMLIPDYLGGVDVDLRAGGATVYEIDKGELGLPREWMTLGKEDSAQWLIERKEKALDDAFFVSTFQLLDQLADKDMTAYEISQRLAEKLQGFTPTFDRRVTEFLNPLLRRTFGMLYRQGKFGMPPASLMVDQGGGRFALAMPEIVITSRISLALKALQAQGIVNTLAVLQPMAQLRPDILDNFDMDKIGRNLSRNYGMSPDNLVPMKQVNAVRAEKAKIAQQQRALMAAGEAAKAAKDLGGAPQGMQDAVMSATG